MLHLVLLLLAADPDSSGTKRSFPELKHGQVLFTVQVPKAGFWEFCLEGKKPAGQDPKAHTLAFGPVVLLPAGPKQIDSGGVVFPQETTFHVCARQRPGAAWEMRLEAGQRVELWSAGETKGPVQVTMTFREVQPP